MCFGLLPGRLAAVRGSRDCHTFSRNGEQMQTLSTSPTRDRLTHIEQVYKKPEISSRMSPIMFTKAVIAKEAAKLNHHARTLDTSFVSTLLLIIHASVRLIS